MLVVDAFSGDSIPVHLLTAEAMQLYFRRLTPSGVLAIHVSNRYLDLAPVIETASRQMNRHARLYKSDANLDRGAVQAHWVVVAGDPVFFARPEWKDAQLISQKHVYWTDDYSNLLAVIRR